MPTPLDIITNAFRDINVLGAGDPIPTAEDTELALSHYNRLIDRWRALGRMSYFEFSQAFYFALSKPAYTLGMTGSGADFIITGAGSGVRPPKINRAKLVLSGGYETDLPILFKREYESISLPNLTGHPLRVYYQPSFPAGTLYPYPYPTTPSDQIRLYFGSQLATIAMAEIQDNIDMPPALEDALTFSLSERLCIPFAKAMTDELRRQAHGARQVYSQLNDGDPVFIGTGLQGEYWPRWNYVTTFDGH